MIQKIINHYSTLPILVREFEIYSRKSSYKDLPNEGLWLRWIRGGLGYSLKELSCIGRCEHPLKLNAKYGCQVTGCSFAQDFLNSFAPTSSPTPYRLSLLTPKLNVKRVGAVHRHSFTLTLFGQSIEHFTVWHLAVQRTLLVGLGKNQESYLIDRVIDSFTQKTLWSVHPLDPRPQSGLPNKKTPPTLAHFLEKNSSLGYIPRQVQVTFLTAVETKLLDSIDRNAPLSISLEHLILLNTRNTEAAKYLTQKQKHRSSQIFKQN